MMVLTFRAVLIPARGITTLQAQHGQIVVTGLAPVRLTHRAWSLAPVRLMHRAWSPALENP